MEDSQQNFSIPRIGDHAPEFQANTTQGSIDFPSQYQGQRAILFSHPSDFTPVCTTEFMVFASKEKQFNDANCQLIGLSIGSVYSHIAWLRLIKEKIEFKGLKYIDIKFPVVEDLTMEVAKKYGMIHPGENNTKTVRAVFFIDPKGVIIAIVYYPMNVGRNIDELYRVLLALQTVDTSFMATPAGREPGDDVIVPASTTSEVAENMFQDKENVHCDDWYFCSKKLPQEDIEKTLHINNQ